MRVEGRREKRDDLPATVHPLDQIELEVSVSERLDEQEQASESSREKEIEKRTGSML